MTTEQRREPMGDIADMKIISLWEPWATLMAIGAKRIETRSWRTSHRGWLAIHAAKGGLTKSKLAECIGQPGFRLALASEVLQPGRIVAVVQSVDCCPMEETIWPGVFDDYPELDTEQERLFGNYDPGRWAWVTDGLTRLVRPIPFRGRQGISSVPSEIIAEIARQMEEATR